MKATGLKRIVPMFSLALLGLTAPLMAQNYSGGSSDAGASRANTQMNEPAGANNPGSSNWAWLGLLGLLGLFGLRRHHDVRDDAYRAPRTT